MSVIGIDIGGANLKFSDGRETNRTVPFPLWRDPNGLSRTLHDQLKTLPDARQLAVTMTGELCDCFERKQQGVQSIVDSVETCFRPFRRSLLSSLGKIRSCSGSKRKLAANRGGKLARNCGFDGHRVCR